MTVSGHARAEYARSFCQAFEHSARPKYILGTNEYALSVAEHINIDGYINDFAKTAEFGGKPIVPIEAVPSDALVLTAVVYRPNSARARVEAYPFDSLDYYAFIRHTTLDVKDIDYWQGFREDLETHAETYRWLHERFEDEESRQCFNRLVDFRKTYDIEHMREFTCREKEQYFEPFLGLQTKGEVFVDIGGYDGQTTLQFIRHCPDYKRIHYFEPSADNMRVSQQALSDVRDIKFHPEALSNQTGTVGFSSDGSSSRVAADDDNLESIRAVRFDELINEPTTFIKMDIEGFEHAALEGAQIHIRDNKPRLAVCVYHRPDDFRTVPERVLSYYPDYKVYLRHYMEGFTETVMFFVPPSIE
ncbi:FkbM family methyltransferase [Marinobacter fonticola]|uniref:FkbM family methyltransferase n=1 Tax=Marinobacter fonticola TaxID=2603215 RepID=UPI0011E704DD|nr:FkbM family methyltransferase [Marinobacter fonticola]